MLHIPLVALQSQGYDCVTVYSEELLLVLSSLSVPALDGQVIHLIGGYGCKAALKLGIISFDLTHYVLDWAL